MPDPTGQAPLRHLRDTAPSLERALGEKALKNRHSRRVLLCLAGAIRRQAVASRVYPATVEDIDMATNAKTTAKTSSKTAAKTASKSAAKKATPVKAAKKTAAAAPTPKPLKDKLNKSSLVSHLVAETELDPKTVKTVLAHLENTMVSALNKKGAGEFTLPGLLKITAVQVPATKKRFGKNPFTGQEQWFPAKPASVKVKVRALKKLKDAAL